MNIENAVAAADANEDGGDAYGGAVENNDNENDNYVNGDDLISLIIQFIY